MRPNLESSAALDRCFLRELMIKLWRFFSTLTALTGTKFSHSLTNCLLMALSVTDINKLSAKYYAKIIEFSLSPTQFYALLSHLRCSSVTAPQKSTNYSEVNLNLTALLNSFITIMSVSKELKNLLPHRLTISLQYE